MHIYMLEETEKKILGVLDQVLLDQNSIHDLEWIIAEQVRNMQRKKD